MKQSLHRYLAPIAGGALLAMLLSPLPALAHHGWGGNEDKEFELSGTVTTGVSLAGPHGTMKVKDAQGNIWDITMAPPFRTQQAGLKDGTIPLGSTVTIHGHRNKDPKKFEIKTERVTFNGKVYNVYPDRD
jgi:hypothetical protein